MPHPRVCVAADADVAVNLLIVAILDRVGFEVRHLARPWELSSASLDGACLVVLGGKGSTATAASATREIRATGNTVPTVILMNSADPDAVSLAWGDPAVRLLQKPFEASELIAVVSDLMDGE
jgi:DNA-binding response OmpR family regulator